MIDQDNYSKVSASDTTKMLDTSNSDAKQMKAKAAKDWIVAQQQAERARQQAEQTSP